MIYIWGTPIVATVEEILHDLKREAGNPNLFRDMKTSGNNIMITCPFHKNGMERRPSFGITMKEVEYFGRVLEAGSTHCYTCSYKSDLPKFVADVLGLDSRLEGFRWLKNRYMYGAGSERGELHLEFSRDKKTNDIIVDKALVSHYMQELANNKRAMEYLIKRRIGERALIEMFNIGYDKETDSVVFPVADRQGQVRLLKKRSIEGKKFHNTTGANKAGFVYGLFQLIKFGEPDDVVWVCESEIDCLTAWAYGGQAIAIMGSHISDEQVKEIARTPFRHLVDGLDRDEAGRKGWRALKDKMLPLGFRLWNTKGFNGKKDINELSEEEFKNIGRY